MNSQLTVSSAPHIIKRRTTTHVMGDVLLALLPAGVMAGVLYGLQAIILWAVCVVSSVVMEFVYQKLMKLPITTKDLSAAVTGTLLAFCLPANLPLWMAVFGCLVSIIVTKQLFGGLGRNFANPAIVGRIVLMLSFAKSMAEFPPALDGVAGATPLSSGAGVPIYDLLIGNMGGSMGEVCAVALIAGGIYLVVRRVITVTIPLTFLGSMAALSLVMGLNPLYHILTGGALLGAIFMATDYVSSPSTEGGKAIFGIACGLITMLIRVYGANPEGVSYAILLMNILTPHIDSLTRTRPLGGIKLNEQV